MKNLFCILLLLLPLGAQAQGSAPVAERRAVPEEQWRQASGDLDYSRDLPAKPKPKKERKTPESSSPDSRSPSADWGGFSQFWGNFFQVLAILTALALIAYGVFRMIREPRNRKIARDGAEITLDNLDEYIHETDLERFLREALAQQNYPLAIRLYFLQIIKSLSQNGAIQWSKEKTNRDYLREMRQHPLAQPFRVATHTFEYTWYGNAPLSRTDFEKMEPVFKSLLATLKSNYLGRGSATEYL